MNCAECEDKLFEFNEGVLSPDEAAAVDAHLATCEDCSALLSDIWQMKLTASRWQVERPVPWQKTSGSVQNEWQLPQVIATAASIVAIVLVLADITLWGGEPTVTSEDLAALKTEILTDQDARFDKLTDQQVESNQLLVRTLLETSRNERQEELTTLVNYWNASQAQYLQNTEDSLRYLLASQVEDERDIQQLNDALRSATMNNLK